MPLILGTNSIKDTGYEVANSLRFNDDDLPRLTRTPSSSGNRRTYTISAWIKIGAVDTGTRNIFSAATNGSNYALFRMENHRIEYLLASGSVFGYLSTNRLFRDPSAWYHIVVAIDTTNATAGNRMRLYVNGVEETDFATDTNPSLNADTLMNHTNEHNVGMFLSSSSGSAFDGYIAELVVVDGQQLDPTSFGEFDSDTEIWKPKDVSGLTFGTNGIHLDFEDSSTLGNDVSGNNNDYSSTNLASTDQSTDTCTNNFCTLNPLVNQDGSFSLSQGNLQFLGTGGNDHDYGTMAVQGSGKWYFEVEFDNANTVCYSGFADLSLLDDLSPTSAGVNSFIGMYRNDNTIKFGTSVSSQSSSNGDIFGFALNLDASSGSKTVIVQKNGTTLDTITIPTANENNFFVPIVGDTSSSDGTLKCNFGNPIETVSSGNSDAEGFGNFEYSPTIGGVDYLALCSKNLAEYG